MIIKSISMAAGSFLLACSMQANAALDLIGQGVTPVGTYGLVYDSDLDITWLDYTKISSSWQGQLDWAADLTVQFNGTIYDNWRLPATVEHGVLALTRFDGSGSNGYNVTTSELGHLFYTEFGNAAMYAPDGSRNTSYGLLNKTPFVKLDRLQYWSSTQLSVNSGSAWVFHMSTGEQDYGYTNGSRYAIAVHPGNLAAVPEPGPSTLFLVGGAMLALRRLIKR